MLCLFVSNVQQTVLPTLRKSLVNKMPHHRDSFHGCLIVTQWLRGMNSEPWGCEFDNHTGHGSLLKPKQFHLPNFAASTQLKMSTNTVGKVPAMD